MATVDPVADLLVSLQDVHDTEETLLSYARECIKEPGGYEQFVNDKIGKLFGLASTYRKAFDRHGVTTKDQFDELVKRNFRHRDIQELEEDIHQLETDWDSLLQDVDKQLEVGNSNVLQSDNRVVGARIVVISFGLREGALKWLEDVKCPFPMLLDHKRQVWSIKGLLFYSEKMAQGIPIPKPYENVHDDPQQMGGDFILDKTGQVKYSYCSKVSYDRPAVDDILQELQDLQS